MTSINEQEEDSCGEEGTPGAGLRQRCNCPCVPTCGYRTAQVSCRSQRGRDGARALSGIANGGIALSPPGCGAIGRGARSGRGGPGCSYRHRLGGQRCRAPRRPAARMALRCESPRRWRRRQCSTLRGAGCRAQIRRARARLCQPRAVWMRTRVGGSETITGCGVGCRVAACWGSARSRRGGPAAATQEPQT